jgi:hypothetical protein
MLKLGSTLFASLLRQHLRMPNAFEAWISPGRHSEAFSETIFTSRVERIQAPQAHPVPKHAHFPRGPFPPEMFAEPTVITEYPGAYPDDGSNLDVGTTAQNGFKSTRWLRCAECFDRVKETETESHVCNG